MRKSARKRFVVEISLFVVHTDVHQIDALYECCNAFYQKQGEDASTVSCPKFSLLKYVYLFSVRLRVTHYLVTWLDSLAEHDSLDEKGSVT